jgi:L-aspartate oxidase
VRTDFPERDERWQRASNDVRLDGTGRPVVAARARAGAA